MKKIFKNRLKKIGNAAIKDIKNFFTLKKENEEIKDRIIRDDRNLLEHEEEKYYKPVRVGNFWGNNYIQYESNGDGNKTIPAKEYLNKIRTCLKEIINELKKSDTWKIQLMIAISFMLVKILMKSVSCFQKVIT